MESKVRGISYGNPDWSIRATGGVQDRAANAAGDWALSNLHEWLEGVVWALANDTGTAGIAYAVARPA